MGVNCLHFAGSVADNPEGGVVERATFAQPSGLHPTIYLSEAGVQTKLSGQVGKGGDSQDMLSLALKIATDSYKNQKVGRWLSPRLQ